METGIFVFGVDMHAGRVPCGMFCDWGDAKKSYLCDCGATGFGRRCGPVVRRIDLRIRGGMRSRCRNGRSAYFMEITRKIFWTEAMKGGTIIGMTVIAFQILQMWVIEAAWLRWLAFAVFVSLVYGLTRRVARRSSARYGFPYDRCVGFTLAMMLFVGVLFGVYLSVAYRIMGTEAISSVIGELLGQMPQLSSAQVEMVWDMAYKFMLNPMFQVVNGVVTYCIRGGIVGIFTSALVARRPDIFAEDNDVENGNQSA